MSIEDIYSARDGISQDLLIIEKIFEQKQQLIKQTNEEMIALKGKYEYIKELLERLPDGRDEINT
jgi:hypothetical protein